MLKKTIRFALKSVVTLALRGVLVAIFSALALIIYLNTDKNLNVNELTAMAKAQDRSTKLYYTVTDEHNKIIANNRFIMSHIYNKISNFVPNCQKSLPKTGQKPLWHSY